MMRTYRPRVLLDDRGERVGIVGDCVSSPHRSPPFSRIEDLFAWCGAQLPPAELDLSPPTQSRMRAAVEAFLDGPPRLPNV